MEEKSFMEKLGYRKMPSGFSTKAIHAGQDPGNWKSNCVVTPIVTSAIYTTTVPRTITDFFYTRHSNPTRSVLEEAMAGFENSEYCLAFSAGVSAIVTVLLTLKEGDGVICSKSFYSGTNDAFNMVKNYGFEVDFIDFENMDDLKKSLKPNTKIVWAETCMNPTMKVLDIKAIADIVHSNSSAILVVDNTFLPYFCRPLELDADIVLYSLTKYFCGHSDVIGGSIVTNKKDLYDSVLKYRGYAGTMSSPFDSYLIIRSMKTMSLRMEKHAENSYLVAKFLENHPKIRKVNHPGLQSHEGNKIALKQWHGHSGVFSFYLKEDSYENTVKFLNSLKMIPVATSLGGVETTIAFPREMSHWSFPYEECAKTGVTFSLIRISIGIEDADDIIEDLNHALEEL